MTIQEQLQQRIQSLKIEYKAGQKMLADLEAKQANLRDTLHRISGAIEVLEEIVNESLEPAPENEASAAEVAAVAE